MTCKQGERHRWDESRSRCLDCGRDAATIAEELEDWLAETEDARDRDADQLAQARAAMQQALDGLSDPTVTSIWVNPYDAFDAIRVYLKKYPEEPQEEEE